MRKIAVYGSLLSKLHNHKVIGRHVINGGAKLLGEDVLKIPYKMFDLGCYPGLIPTPNKETYENIFVEVYEVNDDCNEDVERLEGFYDDNSSRNYYNKAIVESTYGDVEIYIYNNDTYSGITDLEVQPVDNVVNWKAYYLTLKEKF